MANRLIDQICAKEPDSAGNRVEYIYAKKPPEYLVYRDPMRVMVHFADSDRSARRQRATLAALNPLRGQISGLIDGWRNSSDRKDQSRACRYDRRVADALIMGLEGGVADAIHLLEEIRGDIIAERRSMAQTDYLLVAAAAGVMLLMVIFVLSRDGLLPLRAGHDELAAIWTGASGGVLGAFFSIAIGLRSRSILIDLQQWDNRRDAILRIAVGTIGGAILICLFLSKLFQIGDIDFVVGDQALIGALMFGFLAGFSERAVPDLLAKANLTGAEFSVAGNAATNAATANAVAAAVAASASNPAGALAFDDEDDGDPPGVDRSEDALDDCLCDLPAVPGAILTDDRDLPVASGGIADNVPAAAVDAATVGEAGPAKDGKVKPKADEPVG